MYRKENVKAFPLNYQNIGDSLHHIVLVYLNQTNNVEALNKYKESCDFIQKSGALPIYKLISKIIKSIESNRI